MAMYLQQNIYLRPCAEDNIKKYFEQALAEVGAIRVPENGKRSWSHNNHNIDYKFKKTKAGVTLSYLVFYDNDSSKEKAYEIIVLINDKVKKIFLPSKSVHNEASKIPQFRIAITDGSYYGGGEVVNDTDNSPFSQNYNWLWGIVVGIGVLFSLYIGGVFDSNSSSSSSYSTPSANTTSSFTSAKDVLRYIDGESIYTSLGYLYVRNGSVYDGAGEFVNNVIVDSYTSTSAIIEIYPSPYGGTPMKFKVDKTSGNISRIN